MKSRHHNRPNESQRHDTTSHDKREFLTFKVKFNVKKESCGLLQTLTE